MVYQREEAKQTEIISTFVRVSGLRKSEVERLKVRDISFKKRPFVYNVCWVHVEADGDIPAHDAPVFMEHRWLLRQICQGRAPDERIFPVLPDVNYEQLRQEYEQELFLLAYDGLGSTGSLISLQAITYLVKDALGLRYQDDTLRSLLRWARRDLKRWLGNG